MAIFAAMRERETRWVQNRVGVPRMTSALSANDHRRPKYVIAKTLVAPSRCFL
jgi:hypothetical protein